MFSRLARLPLPRIITAVRHDGAALRADNQSFMAEFIRLSHDVTPPRTVVITLSALAIFFGASVAKRQLDAGCQLDALVALGLGSVLASPVSWTHHWLWVVPLLMVTVFRRRWITSWTLGAVFLFGQWRFSRWAIFRS